MTARPLQWTPDLAVGVHAVDEQHQELFRRGARLITALRGGDHGEVLPTLDYLDTYALHHFELEERLMRESRYPGLAEHAAVHAAFRADLASMLEGFHRSGPTAYLALSVHNWLADWLRGHLGGVDLELGRFLASRGR